LQVVFRDVIEDSRAMEEMLRLTQGNRRVPVMVADGQVSVGFGGS
jgi:glutaredoxin 3